MGPDAILVLAGVALFVVGVLGGGLTVKEVAIPPLTRNLRYICFFAGVIFIAGGIATAIKTHHETKVDTPRDENKSDVATSVSDSKKTVPVTIAYQNKDNRHPDMKHEGTLEIDNALVDTFRLSNTTAKDPVTVQLSPKEDHSYRITLKESYTSNGGKPKIFDTVSNGKIDIEQAKAFVIHFDHETHKAFLEPQS